MQTTAKTTATTTEPASASQQRSGLLALSDLRVEFKLRRGSVRAVDGVSFEVAAGECVGVVGESGCGKTTTGMSIMGLLAGNGRVTGGQILFEGTDLAQLDDHQLRHYRGNEIALIPQDPLTSLNPTTRIGRQIAEAYLNHRDASRDEANRRAIEVLEMVEMPRPHERVRQYPFELSGGLRQRVIIAMGLVCQPKLLIADEPTTALDVTIQAQILDIFDRLRTEQGMAVLLITHDMGVIAGRTDRVVVMYAGKKIEEAATQELFTSMRHPYTQALLSSVPSLETATRTTLRHIPGLPPDLAKELVGCRFAARCPRVTDECVAAYPGPFGVGTAHEYACIHPVDGPAPFSDPEATHGALPARGSQGLLSVEHLVKEFPVRTGLLHRTHGAVHAVSDVSFEVREGETFGLVGESGCGKTTIGRMIVGIEPSDAGSIVFLDTDVTSLKGRAARRARKDRQMMFQDPYSSLDPRMRVRDIVREPLQIQGLASKAAAYRRVAELLESVGLEPTAGDRHPHEFSGGQRQRIGLARALALNPKLIVADEPVSALDVSIQAQILNLMRDLQRDLGLSYVFISHDLAVVYYMADTIGVMYLGKLVEVGDAESVFRTPAHPYTKGLLDAVPVPDPARARAARGAIAGELPSAADPPSGCRFRTRCPRAEALCAEVEPPFDPFSPTHVAACHFPLIDKVELQGARRSAGAGDG